MHRLKIKLKSCSACVTDIACCCDTLFSPVVSKRVAEVLLMVVFKSNLQSSLQFTVQFCVVPHRCSIIL